MKNIDFVSLYQTSLAGDFLLDEVVESYQVIAKKAAIMSGKAVLDLAEYNRGIEKDWHYIAIEHNSPKREVVIGCLKS